MMEENPWYLNPKLIVPGLVVVGVASAGIYGYVKGRQAAATGEEQRVLLEQQAAQQATGRQVAMQLWLEQNAPMLWGAAGVMALAAGYFYMRSRRDAQQPAVQIIEGD